MAKPTARQLQIHLANDVYFLVQAAIEFVTIEDRDTGVAFQNSVFMKARNVLEFTKPTTRPGNRDTWWIADAYIGGGVPDDPTGEAKCWTKFVNSNIAHLGADRLKSRGIPLPPTQHDTRRLAVLAKFCLQRVKKFAPAGRTTYGRRIRRVVRLGMEYLDGNADALKALEGLMVT